MGWKTGGRFRPVASLYDTVNYLGRRPHIVHGFKRRGFLWSQSHGCFIYLGRELTDREFNGVIDKALREEKACSRR